MLDFGSGLGTAVWYVRQFNFVLLILLPYLILLRAAYSVWGNSIYEYQTIDSSPDMGELAQVLRIGMRLLFI